MKNNVLKKVVGIGLVVSIILSMLIFPIGVSAALPAAELIPDPITDDFESYQGGSSLLNQGKWGAFNTNSYAGAAPVVDATTFANTDHKNVIKFTTASDGIALPFGTRTSSSNGDNMKSGAVELKFSINVSGKSAQFFAFVSKQRDKSSGTNILRSDSLYIGSCYDSSYRLGTMVKDQWYDVVCVVDATNQLASTKVYAEDGMLVAGKVESMTDDCYANELRFQLKRVSSDGGAVYIDDVSVKAVDSLSADDYMIYEDNFEMNNLPVASLTAVSGKNEPVYVETQDSSHGDVLGFGSTSATSDETTTYTYSGIQKNIGQGATTTTDVSAGKFKITYDVKNSDNFMVTANDSSSSTSVVLAFFRGVGVYHSLDTTSDDYKICTKTADEWVTVENIIDLDNKKLYTTVKKADGTTVSHTRSDLTTRGYLKGWGGATQYMTNFSTIRFEKFSGTTNDETCFLDNVKIQRYLPEVESVTLTDIEGETIATQTDVTPGVAKIALDLGVSAMDSDSFTNKVTLTYVEDAAEKKVEFTGSLDANDATVYNMTFDTVLKPETEYTLTVGQDIKDTMSYKMHTDYKYVFTTSEADCTATIDGVYNGDTKYDNETNKITNIADNFTVKMNYLNTTSANETAELIIAYYKEGVLKFVQLAENDPEFVTGLNGNCSADFATPSVEFDTMKVFLWNSMSGMRPYCDAVTLTK